MDFWTETLVNAPRVTLVVGSALLALGLTVLLVASLQWLRRRNTRDLEVAPVITAGEVLDVLDTRAEPTPDFDLTVFDERLDEIEERIESLHRIVEQLAVRGVRRPMAAPRTTPETGSAAIALTAEENELRALVARGH